MKISELKNNFEDYLNKEIVTQGWIRNQRASKNVAFIELNDGSTFNDIQIVLEPLLNNYEEITKLGLYSSIRVKGVVVLNNKQGFEIQAKDIEVIGESDKDYPLQKKQHSFEFLRTIAHLRPRTNTFRAVFKIRSIASMAIHEYFQQKDFVYVQTPLITGSDAEGAGEMFTVTSLDLDELPKDEKGKVDMTKDFFGKPVHLTVSGQLNGEAFAHAFGDIYTFGPTFRAENSNTVKHAAEFWVIEPEMAFADINDLMDIAEGMTKYVVAKVLELAKAEIEFCEKYIEEGLIDKLINVRDSDFAKVTYTEAIKLLNESKEKFEIKPDWGIDLGTEHERYLSEKIFGKPVFVIDYPKDIKAFYMKRNADGKTVAAMDLLVPGIGELIGGSQREEDFDTLMDIIESNEMEFDEYDWYMDLRKYGTVVHSGFGLGFERLIMYLTGMENIRDVIPFPRTPKNCDF